MKRTPLQLNAWWSSRHTRDDLASHIDHILRASEFTVHDNVGTSRRSRRRSDVYGWDRLALDKEKVFFGLCSSTEGPWLHLQFHTRRRRSLQIFEDLFTAVIANLAPVEGSLRIANTDDLPVLARNWCHGGLGAIVNEDTDPPTVRHPGDPAWFRAASSEQRYFANDLMAREALAPETFAATTHRIATPTANGCIFTGGPWPHQERPNRPQRQPLDQNRDR